MIWDNGTWLEFVLIFLSLYTTCEKLSALYRRFFSSSAVLPSYLCLAELLEFMSDSFFYVNLSVIPLLGVLFKNALVLLVSKTQNGHTKDRLYLNPRLGVKWEGQSRGAGDFNVFSHTHESWGEELRENKEKSFKNQHFLKTSSTTPLSGYCA